MKEFDINKEYRQLHNKFPISKKKPIIGITTNFNEGNACLAEAYYTSVIKAGGSPLLIPPYSDRDALTNTIDMLDGIILSGGADIDPRYMGEQPNYDLLHSINPQRDEQELILIKLAADRHVPMLGICRGMQAIAITFGGKVYQDIHAQNGSKLLNHSQEQERAMATHSVNIVKSSLLEKIFNISTLNVNSFHHQAVSELPDGFSLTATSDDGIFEAMESNQKEKILAVQWHPESFIMKDNNHCMMPIFNWIVNESSIFGQAKELHRNIISIDSHCDTPLCFSKGYRLDKRDDTALVDIHKMSEGRLDAAVMVAYLKQGALDEKSTKEATANAIEILKSIDSQINRCQDVAEFAQYAKDVVRIKKSNKKSILSAIENGYAIGKELNNIELFHDMGITYMTLCHNGDNDICDSAKGKSTHNGLSLFGRNVVREMNDKHIIIDLSHASEKTFFDTLKITTKPVVCSHSCCKELCNHPRNISDEQLKALSLNGGVVQITMYKGFLNDKDDATIDDFIAHIKHAVSVAGIDHVGIGSDFDGDGGVPGCSDASAMINITCELLRNNFTHQDIEKLWAGNWLRVMESVR